MKKSARKRKPLSKFSIPPNDAGKKIALKTRRRFWLFGLGSLALLYHSYGILSGVYSELSIVPYDFAIGIGVLEALLVLVLLPLFLWKTVVWWHDRPRLLKHFVDDPGLLD
jgi:hypothetical protein